MTSALIFTRTKHGANKLLITLKDWGKKAAVIHSNRSQSQRQQALQGFKDRRYQILVATDIAARGIDVKDISHVINYDVPRHPEDYVHRIGRTGRAQAVGEAFTLVAPDEEPFIRRIEAFIKKSISRGVIPDFPYQSKPNVFTAPVKSAEHRPQQQHHQPNRHKRPRNVFNAHRQHGKPQHSAHQSPSAHTPQQGEHTPRSQQGNEQRPAFNSERPRRPFNPNFKHKSHGSHQGGRPFNPNQERAPFDPNKPRRPYNPNQPRPPFDPNKPRRPYNPNQARAPFDPNKPRRPYNPNGGNKPLGANPARPQTAGDQPKKFSYNFPKKKKFQWRPRKP
jgi:superfamily II DNA/RNA helicase